MRYVALFIVALLLVAGTVGLLGQSIQVLGLTTPANRAFNLLSTACALTFGGDGGMQVVRRNTFTNSEALDLWAQVNGASVAANTATSPRGDLTSDTITLAQQDESRVEKAGVVVSGLTYVASFYAKVVEGTTNLRYRQWRGASYTSTSVAALTTEWQRFTLSFEANSTGTATFQFTNFAAYAPVTAIVWGVQFELGSTPTTYQATDAFGVSRETGLDAWAARWNLLLNSDNFASGYTASGVTATSVGGGVSRLVFESGSPYIFQSTAVIDGAYTVAFDYRSYDGDVDPFYCRMYDGSYDNGPTLTPSADWQSFSMTKTLSASASGRLFQLAIATENPSSIEIRNLRAHPGSTARDYQRTESGQRIFDVSLHGKSGWLGSAITAGADDPANAVSGGYVVGKSFDGGDFITMPNLGTGYGITAVVYLPADLTAATMGQVVFNANSATVPYSTVLLGSSWGDLTNEIISIRNNTTELGNYTVGWCDAAGTLATGWHTIQFLMNASSQWTLFVDGAEKTLTVVGGHIPIAGSATTRIGANPTNYLANGTIVGYFAYHPTAPNQKSEYDTAKRKMALRGVTLP